ncbi:MAG: hypothetical protein KAU49_05000 [Candidatus Krumholzibacteria bacterium]|nr:hypothetical protein [Candidatus Krumholzibacteria bacterium]
MEHEVRFEKGIVIVRVWGKADPDGYAATTASIVSLPDWKTGTPILVDYEDLDLTEASIADVRDFASASARFRKELGHCLCAVVNSKRLDFGLARMWQVFMNMTSDVEVTVHYNVEDAMSWIEENMRHNC